MDLQEKLVVAMSELNEELILTLVKTMSDSGFSVSSIIAGLNEGISVVGQKFECGEYFIGDLVVSGMLYQSALSSLSPFVSEEDTLPIGKVVIGVVAGDVHDIGKDIIVSLLRSEGFEAIDLGVDVKPQQFVEAVRTYLPDVLLLSSFLGLAIVSMQETIDQLAEAGLRDVVPVFIGGSCTSEFYCEQIHADGWAYDTATTLAFCKKIIEDKYGRK